MPWWLTEWMYEWMDECLHKFKEWINNKMYVSNLTKKRWVNRKIEMNEHILHKN